jgi:HEAT repeat protein
MLAHEKRDVRAGAALILGEIGSPAAIANLVNALGDGESDVRQQAVEGLAKIGTPAMPGLEKALQDKDWQVRESAARALGRIGRPAVDDLARLVENGTREWSYSNGSVDTKIQLRAYAASALLAIGASTTGYYLYKKALEARAAGMHIRDNSPPTGPPCFKFILNRSGR